MASSPRSLIATVAAVSNERTVTEQTAAMWRALDENRQRDALLAGRRVLTACKAIIDETQQQAACRNMTAPSATFGAWWPSGSDAQQCDAHRVQHYLAIAEATSATLDTRIDRTTRLSVERSVALMRSPPPPPHISRPEPRRENGGATVPTPPLPLVPKILELAAERERERRAINADLECTAVVMNGVVDLVNRAEPLVNRIGENTGAAEYDVEASRRNVQRHHDRHVSVALSNQPPGILLSRCGLTLNEELRIVVAVASAAVTALLYYGTIADADINDLD